MQTEDQTITAGDDNVIEGGVTVVKDNLPDMALVVTNPEKFSKDLFEPFFERLTKARRKAGSTRYNIETTAGMEVAKMLAKDFQKIRTDADKVKVKFKKPLDLAGKTILAECERLATAAKAEEAKHEQAIADEKNRLAKIEEDKRKAEATRIEAIQNRLAFIRNLPGQLVKADAATLGARLEELSGKQLDPKLYDEFLPDAVEAMTATIEEVRQLHAEAVDREARDAELARLQAAEEERQAAAAAMQKQQQQMGRIMAVQSLATNLTASGNHTDRTLVAAALATAKEFNPDDFGDMKGMAELVRGAAVPALEAMLASIPQQADPVAVVEAASLIETELAQQSQVLIDEPAEEVPAATVKVIPAPARPSDMDILEAVAHRFEVPAKVALSWLITFEPQVVHAQLEEAA